MKQLNPRILLLTSAAIASLTVASGCTRNENQSGAPKFTRESEQGSGRESTSGGTQSARDQVSEQSKASKQGGGEGSDSAAQLAASSVKVSQLKRDKQAVQKIQEALKSKGYDAGKVDGLWGPNTQAALSKFERDQHLPSDATRIDPRVIQSLGVDLSSSSATTHGP